MPVTWPVTRPSRWATCRAAHTRTENISAAQVRSRNLQRSPAADWHADPLERRFMSCFSQNRATSAMLETRYHPIAAARPATRPQDQEHHSARQNLFEWAVSKPVKPPLLRYETCFPRLHSH